MSYTLEETNETIKQFEARQQVYYDYVATLEKDAYLLLTIVASNFSLADLTETESKLQCSRLRDILTEYIKHRTHDPT